MSGTVKLSSSPLSRVFHFLIVFIFLLGILPAPALAQGIGTIAGQVTDNATGNPVNNALVLVLESGSQIPDWNATTGASGNFSIAVVEGSNYQVAVYREGYITGRTGGQNVTANTTTTVNFSLFPGGIITGTVTDNASSPVENADVRAYVPASPGTFYNSLPTDTSGHYSVTVPIGAGYTVEAEKPGTGSANQTGIAASLDSPTPLDLTLLPPQSPPPPPQDTTPPANITDLAAVSPTHDSITLTWTAPGDDGTAGQASQYDIRYAASTISDNASWDSATPVQSPPPRPAGSSENFTIPGLGENTRYYFAIKTRDDANLWSGLSNSPSANTTQPPPTPYFDIAHSGGKFSFMLGAGENITETFDISSVNNFEGTINLQFNGPPNIQASSSLSPSQVTLSAGQTQTVTLTLGASAMTPSGTYQSGIGGQTSAYGGQQRGMMFTVIVGVSGQPLLSASPAVVAPEAQTNFFASQFPPSANISLKWDSGPKAGQTLAAGQTDESGTWQVQVNIPADMPGGNFSVRAQSGQSSAVFQLTITSGSGPDFIMSSSPQFVSIPPGNSDNITIYVTSVNDFNALVTLSTGSPPGVTCNLSASSVTPGSGETVSATLTISVAEWVPPDMLHINVEGACVDPPIARMVDINLDIPPPADWGPGISLSQSYGQAGDTITVTGSNFPPQCQGETVTIREAVSNTILQTTPATITVNGGSFTGTFTIPPGVPSGNYRIEARVTATGDFAERDFQILGIGETFTLGVSPQSVTVATEQGGNSASASVNIVSVGGNSPSVNLAIEGAPPWLTYKFGSLPDNTAASGDNAVNVPAGGSSSRNLNLTVSMMAPTGTYYITVRGWADQGTEQRISLELTVQPLAGFGMAQLTLSPSYGQNGRTVNISGSGFTGCNPGQVTMLNFAELDILAGQSLPTITVPQTGDSSGKFSGTFRVPAILPPGTYPVKIRVGSPPEDKFFMKFFTITGENDTFVIQASPSFLWVEQGGQINTMIKVQAVGTSSPTVSLSLEGLPPDITSGFISGNLTAPPGGVASTDLNLDTSEWMPGGRYTISHGIKIIKAKQTLNAIHITPMVGVINIPTTNPAKNIKNGKR